MGGGSSPSSSSTTSNSNHSSSTAQNQGSSRYPTMAHHSSTHAGHSSGFHPPAGGGHYSGNHQGGREQYHVPHAHGSNTPDRSSINNFSHKVSGDHRDSDELLFPYCDSVDKYEKIVRVGQGTFGEVFKAKLKSITNGPSSKPPAHINVALKKVLMDNEKEGFPITALREIKILQLLKNENVVRLLEICRSSEGSTQQGTNGSNSTFHYPPARFKATFYLVFEFCEHDLAGLLSNHKVKFGLGEIKKVVQQLLNGLFYIHTNKILHRDMKAANILINREGVLKLADFGLARAYSISQSKPNRYTNRVVTLWYRSPELLLGERNYGPPVDVWGAGCIMAEMWTRKPIMQGNSEQHQLRLIVELCGSINEQIWPGVKELELYNRMELPQGFRRRLKDSLKPFIQDELGVDLLDKLLTLDPKKRIEIDSALDHDFFWTDPMPQDLGRLMSTLSESNFELYAQPRKRQFAAPNGPGAGIPTGAPGQGGHHPASQRPRYAPTAMNHISQGVGPHGPHPGNNRPGPGWPQGPGGGRGHPGQPPGRPGGGGNDGAQYHDRVF